MLSSAILLSNCGKNDFNYPYGNSQSGTTITPQTAVIRIQNKASDPYNIKINDVDKGTINAGTTLRFVVNADESYTVHVKQLSGYTFWATTYTWHLRADADYMYTYSIYDEF